MVFRLLLTTCVAVATLRLSSTQFNRYKNKYGDLKDDCDSFIQALPLVWLHQNELGQDGASNLSQAR